MVLTVIALFVYYRQKQIEKQRTATQEEEESDNILAKAKSIDDIAAEAEDKTEATEKAEKKEALVAVKDEGEEKKEQLVAINTTAINDESIDDAQLLDEKE